MILDKAQLTAHKVASTDNTRHALVGVWVDPDGTVMATDGYSLAEVKSAGIEDGDFPQSPGGEAPRSGEKISGPVLIPTETVKAALKSLPKRSTLPVMESALLDETATSLNGSVVLRTGFPNDGGQTFRAAKETLPRPKYLNVFPKGAPVVRISLNIKRLVALAEIAHATHKGSLDNEITLDIYGPDQAIRVTCPSDRFLGLLMPLRQTEK